MIVERGYYRIEESNDQYTYLDTKWDYQTKTYTATYQRLSMVKNICLGRFDKSELKLEKQKSISHKYDGESFKELYPIVKSRKLATLKPKTGTIKTRSISAERLG